MIVDQEEIESLLSQAENLADEAEEEVRASVPGSPAAVPVAPRRRTLVNVTPEVARLLRIQVPVIVQLAARRMSIAGVRKFSLGMIIEFNKHVDEQLDLLINNHAIGRGDTVKVGDHFGLRITEIRDAATRIKSLGG